MASVQDIKRRVRSIKNTRKITKAMELVAAARLRRAQARIEAMRPYADRMLELMAGTARASTSLRGLPLLQTREVVKESTLLVITSNRGLCGGYNAGILREASARVRQTREEGVNLHLELSGKRGITLDITKESGQKLLLDLVVRSDIVVESFDPGHLAAQNLSYELLIERQKKLILVSISGFG